jgi:hypothetical protein
MNRYMYMYVIDIYYVMLNAQDCLLSESREKREKQQLLRIDLIPKIDLIDARVEVRAVL